MFGPQYALVPIKGFVHEVLGRSRTSGGIIQTALCYPEAVRPKIMQLAEEEKAGKGIQVTPNPPVPSNSPATRILNETLLSTLA